MNCQSGDLAVIVCSVNAENLGLFVDVVGPYVPREGDPVFILAEPMWLCRARGRLKYRSTSGKLMIIKCGPVPDAVLRPIRPPSIEVDRNVKLELAC